MDLLKFATTLNLGLILGIAMLGFYLFKRHKASSLNHAVNSFINGNAIAGGISVCYSALIKGFECNFTEIDILYIFLGGVAVIWVSLGSVIKLCSNSQVVNS